MQHHQVLVIALTFALSQCNAQAPRKYYDFIIAGGGSAGTVLAARLTEDGETTVLLIEAGDDPLPMANVPGLFPLNVGSSMDWQFQSVPQAKGGKSYVDQKIGYPQGKALGGGSAINAMIYHRGNPKNYDDWAEQGNRGWTFRECLQYFIKAEGTQIPELKTAVHRGQSGPLKTSWVSRAPVADAFMKAAAAVGIPNILDHNDPATPTGIGGVQQTAYGGQRQSTYEVYLKPAMKRPNLHILLKAYVSKVLIPEAFYPGQKLVATGVQYAMLNNVDKILEVYATKEVILSAGAFQSPKIMQLSGIGMAADLALLNIKVVKELPVGRNLTDHVNVNIPATFVIPPEIANGQLVNNDTSVLMRTLGYEFDNSFTDQLDAQLNTGLSPGNPQADIQMAFGVIGVLGTLQFPLGAGTKDEDGGLVYGGTAGKLAAKINVCLVTPSSRGYVRAANATDFLAPPIIDPKYFDDANDINVLVSAIKTAVKISNTAPLKDQYKFTLVEKAIADCASFALWSDDYIRCIIVHRGASYIHPTSTCRMGQDERQSVVNSDLRVHGFKNLRVIDASVFPSPTSGNTNAPTIMLAEKAADMIKSSQCDSCGFQMNWSSLLGIGR